jgi:hypothetical protein
MKTPVMTVAIGALELSGCTAIDGKAGGSAYAGGLDSAYGAATNPPAPSAPHLRFHGAADPNAIGRRGREVVGARPDATKP